MEEYELLALVLPLVLPLVVVSLAEEVTGALYVNVAPPLPEPGLEPELEDVDDDEAIVPPAQGAEVGGGVKLLLLVVVPVAVEVLVGGISVELVADTGMGAE